MFFHAEEIVTGYRITQRLGKIRRSGMSADENIARRRARQRLEAYAEEDKQADAVLGFRIDVTRIGSDFKAKAEGFAVRLEEL